MKNHRVAALLCIVLGFAAAGCGTKSGDNTRRKYGTAQTGTNIPRWTADTRAGEQASSKQRRTKAKRDRREEKRKAEKPKRERSERRSRASDEEVITRGGFR